MEFMAVRRAEPSGETVRLQDLCNISCDQFDTDTTAHAPFLPSLPDLHPLINIACNHNLSTVNIPASWEDLRQSKLAHKPLIDSKWACGCTTSYYTPTVPTRLTCTPATSLSSRLAHSVPSRRSASLASSGHCPVWHFCHVTATDLTVGIT